MAEGGTSFENPAYDPHDDDTYDDDDRFNATTPFIQQTSTPHSYGGENIEMQTMQHETSGLPEKSYVETRFGRSKTTETAWVVAKDLFPNMSSTDLEVSYNTKGKLQVKMFGAGKKLYSLMTTERGTGREDINKSLPKEIKTALGLSKFERLQKVTSDKRKELKESQDLAAQKEKNEKEMEEKKKDLEKAEKDLLDLKNARASKREIEKAQAKVRTLEAEKVKASSKYSKSVEAEKNKTSIEVDISTLEDLQDEDEADVERVVQEKLSPQYKNEKKPLVSEKNKKSENWHMKETPKKEKSQKANFLSSTKVINKLLLMKTLSKQYLVKKSNSQKKKKNSLKRTKKFLKKKMKKTKKS